MERKSRPKLKGGGTGAVGGTATAYTCRDHGAPMSFDALHMGWVCPVENCSYRRYKKTEVDQYGPPMICEGPFELILAPITGNRNSSAGDYQIILRGSNNVAVDITQIVSTLEAEASSALQPKDNSLKEAIRTAIRFKLTMQFDHATLVSEDGTQ